MSFSVFSMDIGLEIPEKIVKQGSIVSVKFKIDADSAQEIPLQKLKSKTFAGIIYLHDIGSLIRKEGHHYFEADAKVIFVKVPENNQINFTEDGKSIKIFWNEIEILPTEFEKNMLYGVFEIPERSRMMYYFLSLVLFLVMACGGLFIFKKMKMKKMIRQELLKLRDELIGCNSYDSVVRLWMSRQVYLAKFPQIEKSFRDFEILLFKYMFKPSQSESEKSEILTAYKRFLDDIKGGLDGI
jgi:hypothetical protein